MVLVYESSLIEVYETERDAMDVERLCDIHTTARGFKPESARSSSPPARQP